MDVPARISWKKYRRAFRNPLRTGRGVFDERQGIVLRVEYSGGGVGFGEIAPWDGFGCETLGAAERFLSELRERLASGGGVNTAIPRALPCTRAAFGMARMFPPEPVPGNSRVPALRSAALLAADAPGASLEALRAQGYSTFKHKICDAAGAPAAIHCVRRLLDALLPCERLRLDANGALSGWAPWRELVADGRVEFLEQPFAPERMSGMVFDADIERKLALDESVGAVASLPGNWRGIIVVKPLLLGDWGEFLRWRQRHPRARVVYSSCFETAVGREAVLRLAALDPASENTVHGLGTLGVFDGGDEGWEAHAGGATAPLLRWTAAEWEAWWEARRGGPAASESALAHRIRVFLGERLFPAGAASRARASFDAALRVCGGGGAEARILVVAHTDTARHTGAMLAAVASGQSVCCANPHWGESEWREAGVALAGVSRPAAGEGIMAVPAGGVPAPPRIHVPTGGTGGRVRFAAHALGALERAARAQLDALGAGRGAPDIVSPLPPWHISGIMPVVRALVGGGRLRLCDGSFSGARSLPRLAPPVASPPCRHVSLVPTQLRRLLERAGGGGVRWLRRFDCVLLGGAPVPPDLFARAREAGLRLAMGYGMTETAAFVALFSPEDFLAGRPVSGRILPHVRVQIRDDGGHALPDGVAGRIAIAPAQPETGGAMPGWLVTNDEGILENGRLRVLGRVDRCIVSGGEKIDPRRVEAVLEAVPWVRAALVVGEPDPLWGERAVALVELDGGAGGWEEKLASAVRAALARHNVPKRWVAVPRLPFNERGKLDPRALARCLRRT
ncbi:MAG: o-succinylbenzoate synthase [Puniceicoccales bacterium]|jgi:O-succinylbenzoic acid--CoA ligase|nr:o-succinylbenzoate synthase [Puniceicoccales bacterium]